MKFFLFRFFILLIFAGFGLGCMTKAVQTKEFYAHPQQQPRTQKVEIVGVPFIQQEANACGPATLTMALRWLGKNIHVEQLMSQVYSENEKGSLPSDMISAGRRQGVVAVPIEGLQALMTELEAGHPVIVFQNLGLSWMPQWHYAIVFGYDIKEKKLLMHSGPEAFKEQDMAEFELSWNLGQYWGLVLLPAGELAASAGELTQASAAAALESLGFMDEAKKSYLAILQRWPRSLAAYVGLGNISYHEKSFQDSVNYLKAAAKVAPQSPAVLHNLELARTALRENISD